MILKKQIFSVMTIISSVSTAWGMYKNNRILSIEAALTSAPGTPVSSTPRLGGRPPLSPYSPRFSRTPNSAASHRGSLNSSPLDSELRKRIEAFSIAISNSPLRNRSLSWNANEGSPISQSTPPIPGSPTPHCNHNTVIVAQEAQKLSTIRREIHSAHLYFGADCIDKSVDSSVRMLLGIIKWIVFLDEKKYGIASCEIHYASDSINNDALIKQDFENKLYTFVETKMTELGYTKNK